MPKTAALLAEMAGVQPQTVIPPPGVAIMVHFGPAQKYHRPADAPLPYGAIAWYFNGAGRWLKPHEWPYGQYEQGEAQRVAIEERATLIAQKALDRAARREARAKRPPAEVELRLPEDETGGLPPGFVIRGESDGAENGGGAGD